MIERIGEVLRKNPLLALEFFQYLKLLCLALVGIFLPASNYTNATEATFGNIITNGQYVLALCAAIVGFFTVMTNRLNHRRNAMYFAFTAFAMGTVVAVIVGVTGGVIPSTTFILNCISMLSCGALAIHANWIVESRKRRNDGSWKTG